MTRLIRSSLIISSLLILGTTAARAENQPAPSCDCSCQRYSALIAETLPQSPLPEDELLECAGACAIAWVRCEDQQALTDATDSEDGDSLNASSPAQVSALAEFN